MGTPLPMKNKSLAPTPVVAITAKVGGFFVGRALAGRKSVESKFKDQQTGQPKFMGVYEFAIEDSDLPIQIKVAPKKYVEAKVKPGEKVCMFPPSRLDGALESIKAGDRVKIVYKGKDGQAHDFEAELL